jgi:hypothetical protein
MSMIDKQRITAVRVLRGMGFQFSDGAWVAPSHSIADITTEADRMHALLVERADEISGCPDGSDDDTELKSIADALEAYEAKRWPTGRETAVKG